MSNDPMEAAPIWRRATALTIDLVVIQALAIIIGVIYAGVVVGLIAILGEPSENVRQLILVGSLLIPTPTGAWYFARMDRSPLGQTLGKNLMQCQIESSQPLSVARVLVRRFASAVTAMLMAPLAVGFFNRENRFLHDYATGTRVVMSEFVPPADWFRATFARRRKEKS